MTKQELDERLVAVTPSERQLAYEDLEFIGFFHFTINTFTGREWGDGSEDPKLFNPTKLDALQWVRAMKAAGMKGVILTCKHHDGFCLWPSAYTDHSVKSSPWKNGQGDVVREVADACRAENMKFGIYVSPWDRHEKCYGTGEEYNDYFCHQLGELLTGYGELFCVWFDGACGEGPNGKRQEYDWERYYELIRKYQPKAVISVCGPDVRWCGNEGGFVRPAEWSVVPKRCADTEKVAAKSQQTDDTEFRQRKISAMDQDLGSREILQDEEDLIWYPAEVNVSIRPGWFYHPEEDSQVRTVENLEDIYLGAVGGNANFLLNVPPNQDGLLAEEDVEVLTKLGEKLRADFAHNIAESRTYETIKNVTSLEIPFAWDEPKDVTFVEICEDITKSQRIEKVEILIKKKETWERAGLAEAVGHKKIFKIQGKGIQGLKVRVLEARESIHIKNIAIYEENGE